jgi:NADH-quinone oxidoreductase subunit E
MLSEQEQQEIRSELSRYAQKRAVAPEALKIVQGHRGWVSDQSIKDIAEFLELTVDEVDDVASFYSMIFRRPVGRHVILVCDSVTCWIMGQVSIKDHLAARLGIPPGQTTADGKFTLLPISCLGACDQAPVMMIDDRLYGNLTPEKVEEIIAGYE